jgi:hypothetical protein
VLVVVLVLENPDRFAIKLTEQIGCRTSVSLRRRKRLRLIEDEDDDEHEDEDPNFGVWVKSKYPTEHGLETNPQIHRFLGHLTLRRVYSYNPHCSRCRHDIPR